MSEEQLPMPPHLASEFYAWLWWASEENEGSFDLDEVGRVTLWIDERIAFRLPADNKPSAVVTGDSPAAQPESRAALAGGKVLHDLRIALRRDDREFSATLKGPTMDLQKVKLPQAVDGNPEETLYDRMFLYEELVSVLGALFSQFAKARTGKNWTKETLPKIREWVQLES